MSTSSIKRRLGRFHVVVVRWTSKKCTKKRDAHAELLFCSKWRTTRSRGKLDLVPQYTDFSVYGQLQNGQLTLLIVVFVFEAETLCSLVLSVMSASKKSDNSEGQVQNTRRVYCALVVVWRYINLFIFFQSKDILQKRGTCGHRLATQHEGQV